MKVRQSELHLSRISAKQQVEIRSTVQVKVQVHTRERIYSPNSDRLVYCTRHFM